MSVSRNLQRKMKFFPVNNTKFKQCNILSPLKFRLPNKISTLSSDIPTLKVDFQNENTDFQKFADLEQSIK